MLKLKVLGKVIESGLVAIVRTHSSDQAARIAEACALGGAAAIEITFTVPGAAAVIEAHLDDTKALIHRMEEGTVLQVSPGKRVAAADKATRNSAFACGGHLTLQ